MSAMGQVYPAASYPSADLSEIDGALSASGDWYGAAMNGSGDWYGSMMGDFSLTEAITNLFAGKEFDQLSSALGKVQDQIINATSSLTELEKEKAAAAALLAQPGMYVTVPFAGRIPLPAAIEGLKAQRGVDDGYKAATGLNYMTRILTQVFEANLPKLQKSIPWITGVLVQFQNWDRTWMERVGRVQKYVDLWDHIQNEHNRLITAAGGRAGNWNDPKYIALARQAVQTVTGVPIPEPAGLSGAGDLGIEPVSTTIAIIALIKMILVVAAIIAVVVGIVSVVREFNAAGRATLELRQEYEARKENERQEYMAKCASGGKSVEECTKEWTTYKDGEDTKQKAKEADVAEKYAKFDFSKLLPWAAGGAAVLLLGPKIVEAIF